jgi:hypothetical protein
VHLTKKAMPEVNEAMDALTNERLFITDNTVTVTLSPMRMQLIAVH